MFKIKAFVFSDFQGEIEIPDGEPELVILLGDIYFRYAREIDNKYDCPKIGVLGNHDSPNEWKSTEVVNIHEEVVDINGISFAGFGGSPRYNSKPNQYTEEECRSFIDRIPKVDVFVAHSNPIYEVKEEIDLNDAHRGFDAYNHYIHNVKPKYFLHGHIHNPFELKVGNTMIHSVFPFKEIVIK